MSLSALAKRLRVPRELNTHTWHLFDASGQIVGRMANRISLLLQGKHKPLYNDNRDVGDTVVVVNAEKIHFTGNKWTQKLYRHHTLYPGGLKEVPALRLREKDPPAVLRKAVNGMLPKNKMRRQRMERLHVYAGPQHPHVGQFQSLTVRRPAPLPPGAPADAKPELVVVAQATREPARATKVVALPAYALPNRNARPLSALLPKALPDLAPPFHPKYGAVAVAAPAPAAATKAADS